MAAAVRLRTATPPGAITHDGGSLPEVVDQTLAALVRHEPRLVRWAGGLYLIERLEKAEPGPVARPKGSPVLVPVTAAALVELATRHALHQRFDGRRGDYKAINCPTPVAQAILARGHWPSVPLVAGTLECASLDLDGREIVLPGLDAPTGLYLASETTPPPVRGLAGRAIAADSLQRLRKLLRGFPFVGSIDESAAVAMLMTSVLRRPLPAAPGIAITSSTPGTGKTLLAEVAGLLATGRRPPVMSLGADEAELAKRLGGVLLAGDSILVVDNLTRPIGNEDILNQLLSQPQLRFRPLGGSGVISAPTNLTVLLTGNNLSIVGDLKRRVCLIRLDAQMERPELREFTWDVLQEARRQRDELLRAVLEIAKAYIQAGCPAVTHPSGDKVLPLGGFADWDRLVRRPLIWLGLPDPLASAEELRAADPDLETLRLILISWRNLYGGREVTAAEVVKDGIDYGMAEHTHGDLHDALELACNGKIDSRRLGHWLRQHADRIVDGQRLRRAGADGHAKVARWRLEVA